MKIYCSGIGGIGLSAYASLQRAAGHEVLGSDRSDSALLDDLRSQGITIFLDQSGTSLPRDCDLFVYSEAIPPSAPERERAAEYGILQQSYPQAVGELSRGHTLIAVSGTHGKSSTTAMIARLMVHAKKDPTVVVGTKIQELNGRNWRVGKSDWFVLEACEYRHSFHNYDPTYVLLTTCDGDHFDFYESIDAYERAFVEFLKRTSESGAIIVHGSDPACMRIAKKSGRRIIDADTFPLIHLETPGLHMRQNAQLVLALAHELGIPADQATSIVSGYAGSWRRLEKKGTMPGDIIVIDDYAHHPAEIRATLQGLREAYAGRRIVCVYQPHTHDRTLKLYTDFLPSFRDADLVIVSDVYEARKDIETGKVDLEKFVVDLAKESSTTVQLGGSLAAIQSNISAMTKPGDILVCMGAGDITTLATKFVSAA